MMKRMASILMAAILLLAMSVLGARADDYPRKAITMIVPWGAGGMSGTTSRMLAEKFKKILGQPVIVINKPGASGIVGLSALLKAKPDGYTIGSGALTLAFTAPYFLGSKPFKIKDMEFIGSYMPQERVLFTTPDKPYKNWDQFISYATAHPGEISVGSGGAQWALEIMKSVAVKNNIKFKYVMFKSGGAASSAILGEHVNTCEVGTGTPAYQSARQGRLVVLGNLGSENIPYFPGVENLIQRGYRFATMIEYGMVLPAGVPERIRAKLESALKQVLQDKSLTENMLKMGVSPRFLTGKQFKAVCEKAVESIPALIKYNEALNN